MGERKDSIAVAHNVLPGAVVHSGTGHVVIPGLGQQLYQESLAKSRQDPAGLNVVSVPVEQYWTNVSMSQLMETYTATQ